MNDTNSQLMEIINDFETNLKKRNYENNVKISLSGYLINLEDYEELKKKIKHNLNFIVKIEQIPFKTASYLVNMIYNDNKYIIISTEIWKKIVPKEKENESPIKYKINGDQIFINFEDNKILKFSNFHKNNIIEKSSYYLI